MIVCGKKTSIEEVQRVKLERPRDAGRIWTGIPHGELINALHDEADSRNWKRSNHQFSLSGDKADLVGAFELDVKDIQPPDGMKLSIGFITSNARRRALRVVVGTRVLVCNNGMAVGEILLQHKHTNRWSLYDSIGMAFDLYEDRARRIPEFVNRLKESELPSNGAAYYHVMISAGRKQIMPWQRLGLVDKEYRQPSYSEHAEETSFGLLQAFTHIAKRTPPLHQMHQINQFRETLPVSDEMLELN